MPVTKTRAPRKPRARPTVKEQREAAHAAASRPDKTRAARTKARQIITRTGRPTTLTPKLIEGVAAMILAGNYRHVAAAAHGISRVTLGNWLARGEELDGAENLSAEQQLYVEFLYALSVCEAHSEVDLLAEARSGRSGWQAQMTILERRFPVRWKRRDEVELSGSVDSRVVLTPEQEAAELAAFGMQAAIAVAAGPEAIEPPEDA